MKWTEKPTLFFGVNEKREMAVLKCSCLTYEKKKQEFCERPVKFGTMLTCWMYVEFVNDAMIESKTIQVY